MSDVFADNSGAQAGGATPTPTPAPESGATANTQAAPGSAQAPATGAPGEGWVPSYRIRETRDAAVREAQSQFAEKERGYQEQLARIQSQLHALVGVTPHNQDPEVDAIRQQFSKLYPGLSQLEERAAQLQSIIDRAGDLESQNTHYWQSYGRQSMDRLFGAAEKSLGSPLSEEGKRALHSAFVGFVSSSPDLTARYAEDPGIVDEFWQMFASSLIDPARRVAAAGVAGRAPTAIPQDTPGGAPRTSPAPKPADLDERAAIAWAAYQNRGPKV